MSKTNLFELQTEVYAKIKGGATTRELWEELRGRQEELKHLTVDGNPSNDQFRKGIEGMCKNLEENYKQAQDIGPLAVRQLELDMMANTLAGSVLRSLTEVEPLTIPDSEAILKAYQALSKGVTRETLLACMEYLRVDVHEVYRLDLVRLYGEPGDVEG